MESVFLQKNFFIVKIWLKSCTFDSPDNIYPIEGLLPTHCIFKSIVKFHNHNLHAGKCSQTQFKFTKCGNIIFDDRGRLFQDIHRFDYKDWYIL